MLMALLLPDPCDEHCPPEFREKARALLKPVPGIGKTDADEELRQGLLRLIADFANWDNSANPTYLECARGLVRAAHSEEPPLIVDPFAGGGSIPLEALRVGCDAFASDLNPVACLILKVLLEDIPRHGLVLADELRRVGQQIRDEAEKDLAEFYPINRDGSRPVAYLWARTVRCEASGCGAEIPLVRSFWLAKKGNAKARYFKEDDSDESVALVVDDASKGGTPRFRIARGSAAIVARPGFSKVGGTVSRARAACLACKIPLSPERVRAQLRVQRGGSDVVFDENGNRVGGARLLAIVTVSRANRGRNYRLPTPGDYVAVRRATQALKSIASEHLPNGLCLVPDETLPLMSGTFNVPLYGVTTWGDLFAARQKLALVTFLKLLHSSVDLPPHLKEVASLGLSRFADICNAFLLWKSTSTQAVHMYSRQALGMVWDFPEPAIFGEFAGDYSVTLSTMARVAGNSPTAASSAQVQQADARCHPLPSQSAAVWFTDPPYYFAVPYADLSDFFFVWLKRALPGHPLLRDPSDANNPLTPKDAELCEMAHWDRERYAHKDKNFFETGMTLAFAEGRRVLGDDDIGCVVFAHKTTEGWEALISGLTAGGWTVTASWPITTEMATRLRARESAALAASVHLVCRPRLSDAGVGDWEKIKRELPQRIGNWMERLSGEGIRGADLVFSCIGPALELYSKYNKVLDAQDREIPLGGNPEATEPHERGFLAYIWEIVGRTALQQVLGTAESRARNSAAGALEEDARLTALFLWTLQSTAKLNGPDAEADDEAEEDADEEEETGAKLKKGYVLVYDVVRRFAQPLGIHLDNWQGRIIETKKGAVRLIPVSEREEQLFGTAGTQAVARTLERSGGRDPQYMLFPEQPEGRPGRGRKPRRGRRGKEEAEALAQRREATTLDRVHAAMLLQARGEATALRALLEAEMERSPDFLRLANALSALYPKDSEQKRLLDAMLVAVPR